jgi:polyhydroxyalkanoate synthase
MTEAKAPKSAPTRAGKTVAKSAARSAKTPPKIVNGVSNPSPLAEPVDLPATGAIYVSPAETPPDKSPQARAAPPPAGAPLVAAPHAVGIGALLSADQREAMERLSLNLARAAMTTQAALAGAVMRPPKAPIDMDPFHVGPALGQVMSQFAAQPERMMKAQGQLFERYLDLWRTTTARMAGEPATPVIAPQKGDKRFQDPQWNDNPVFDVMKQSYLLTSTWLNELVASVDGVDPTAKRRVEFFTKLLTDAFSPSNYLVSNPAALSEAMRTGGESLVRGAERFAADLARGGGKLTISQTDAERFKVGENVATASGKVVFENELLQLLQFSPTTDEVYEIPLLIFPPWINKYYILDLRPENSMIRWLTGQGFTVFLTSWVNPGPDLAAKRFDDYMIEGCYRAVEQVMRQTDAPQVNTVGYCIGGTLLASSLAHMAASGVEAVKSATFFAAQQDFTEAGDLLLFTNDDWLADLDRQMDAAGGVLPGGAMSDTFNMLRANDLIWSFFVNNYLLGKAPAAFDLLFWNADQTRMPKALHMGYLRDFYKDNRLAKGELTLGGVRLDLGAVKTPVYVQSSREDHIAPMRSVYRGARLFGGEVTFTLAGSGHIAGVINPPAAGKYQHWTNPALPDTVDEWLEGAVEHKGSWWPHWSAWLAQRSGDKVAARDPASGPLGVIEDAPGRYVRVRSEVG